MDQKKLTWIGRGITAVITLPFLMGVFMMLSKNPQATEGMVKLGWPASAAGTILALEVLSLVLYLVPQTAVLGAVVLTGYLGGAVATHLRAGEAPTAAVIVGVLAWLGLWLREPRLRALMPLRRP